ncbi:MAG: choloylglycine hydrolase [Clostridia bacterium]|nr:choloylglycine hydrolase [Clostridia bacterium]
MCTAVTLKTEDFYFGRTLDYEYSYFEEITVIPRNFPFVFRHTQPLKKHYAIIGMAYNKGGFPLYYDATNEKGLSVAGLNFVGNAYYRDVTDEKQNIAQFEIIPYILGKCATVDEAVELIESINITNTPFSEDLPLAQLHWLIADRTRAVTLEATKEGLNLYENPVGVLTNNPKFPYHMQNLNNYINLSVENPKNGFIANLKCDSKGMGAIGLPGDLSSMSRFVRAVFTRCNSVCEKTENESVNQFFHILGSVEQTRGVNITDDGFEITIYTSCCNATKGIYYYTTYENSTINGVDMHSCDLDGEKILTHPLKASEDFKIHQL